MTRDLFDKERLPPSLDEYLRSTNPWWESKPAPAIPSYHRWVFRTILKKLSSGLASVLVLRGPRQVGKTTLQLQIIEHLIQHLKVSPRRILRVQFDEIQSLTDQPDPILAIARWFENRILLKTFNETARQKAPAFLFLDEVQNLSDWAPQLKGLVDHHTVKVVVTGSSALRISAGRDSLAGRITSMDLGTFLLREIIAVRFGEEIQPHLPENGLEPLLRVDFWRSLQSLGVALRSIRNKGFSEFSRRGGYPMAQANPNVPWPEIADQLNETVIQRAIQHDLRMGKKGQKRDQQWFFRKSCG